MSGTIMTQISADFAATVKCETGCAVEHTQITPRTFSIVTEDGKWFASAVAFICRVPGVVLESTYIATPTADAHIPFDGARVEVDADMALLERPAEYYAYFRTAPAAPRVSYRVKDQVLAALEQTADDAYLDRVDYGL